MELWADAEHNKIPIESLSSKSEKCEKKPRKISFKVSPKGAISIYGMRRFPITMYKHEALNILSRSDDLLEFIEKNDWKLLEYKDFK